MDHTTLTAVLQTNLSRYKAFDNAVGEIIVKLTVTDEPVVAFPFMTVEGRVGMAIDSTTVAACAIYEKELDEGFIQFALNANKLGLNNPELVKAGESEFTSLKFCGNIDYVARSIFFRVITDHPDDMVVVDKLPEIVREVREAKKVG